MESYDYEQEPPNAIQVELTEGCNLRCSFCGLQGIRGEKEKNYKFLLADGMVADRIAEAIHDHGWNPRVEFAMHGEPTMNPNYIGVISTFRHLLPKTPLMMTSNGGGLLRGDLTDNINSLMEVGLNVLLLDNYEAVKIVPKVVEGYRGKFPVMQYPQDPNANPHRRRRVEEHHIVVVQDISKAEKGNHSSLNNHAGSAFPLNNKGAGKPCAKPFREMSIRWDGNVAICCNDWRGVHQIGNVFETPLEMLWQNEQFQAARRRLYRGIRDFGACAGCDALSTRVGLLPDKLGQDHLQPPQEGDLAILARGCGNSPYATPIARQYEMGGGGAGGCGGAGGGGAGFMEVTVAGKVVSRVPFREKV